MKKIFSAFGVIISILMLCTSSCATSRFADEIKSYDNIFIGRLIEYNASYELRELTEFKSVDIIIDEVVKGELSHDTSLYPVDYIKSVSALLCLDDEDCEFHRVGKFGYFDPMKLRKKRMKFSESKIIKSDFGNEIFNYVIIFCNDVFNGYRIIDKDTVKIYDLRFVEIEKLSHAGFNKESKKLKRLK